MHTTATRPQGSRCAPFRRANTVAKIIVQVFAEEVASCAHEVDVDPTIKDYRGNNANFYLFGALGKNNLYQPIVREEARRLAKGLRAFPDQARSLPRRKLAALEAAAEVVELIAGPEMPQRRPGNLGVRRLRPGVKE
jgi:hypothetical protein